MYVFLYTYIVFIVYRVTLNHKGWNLDSSTTNFLFIIYFLILALHMKVGVEKGI